MYAGSHVFVLPQGAVIIPGGFDEAACAEGRKAGLGRIHPVSVEASEFLLAAWDCCWWDLD